MKTTKAIIVNTIALIIMLLVSCGPKTYTSYTITGTIEGLPDGTKMELLPGATHKDEKPIAESVVEGGKFVFTGATEEPRFFYIHAVGSRGLINIMVENGDITVKAKAESSDQNGTTAYTYNNVEVKGSPAHDLYLQKRAPHNSLDSLYQAYHENNKEISEEMGQARQAKNKDLIDSISNTEAWKKLSEDEKNFFETVESTISGIILGNKDSWWGPFFMMDMMSYFTDEQKQWFEQFSQEAKDSYYGKIVKAELYPETLVGKAIPAFRLTDDSGKEVKIESLLNGKKYVLIDFWASWCAPCRKEIPNLKKLYDEYSAKGFEIVSISIDKKEEDWRKALKEEQFKWPNFLDTNGAQDVWGVKAIPAMFLVDESGIVAAEKVRGEGLAETLKELLN